MPLLKSQMILIFRTVYNNETIDYFSAKLKNVYVIVLLIEEKGTIQWFFSNSWKDKILNKLLLYMTFNYCCSKLYTNYGKTSFIQKF